MTREIDEDWLKVAKALPAGQRIRTQCCSQDRSCLISHNERGYSRFCFRCKATEFVPHGIRRISDIVRHKRELEFKRQNKIILPEDYTLDVPTHAMAWYLKCGISPELAKAYGIGYSAYYDRVVLPVINDGKLEALQMRATRADQKPKYLNPAGPKVEAAVFMSAPPIGVTVVVEDILSAIKVGRVTHATSILGTTMTDQRAYRIARDNDAVIVWLDNDKAGKRGSVRAIKQLKMLGVKVYQVQSDYDPKTYSLDEIREHLRNAKR